MSTPWQEGLSRPCDPTDLIKRNGLLRQQVLGHHKYGGSLTSRRFTIIEQIHNTSMARGHPGGWCRHGSGAGMIQIVIQVCCWLLSSVVSTEVRIGWTTDELGRNSTGSSAQNSYQNNHSVLKSPSFPQSNSHPMIELALLHNT
jgi:hypothetical protein